jgi:hypothetical protein
LHACFLSHTAKALTISKSIVNNAAGGWTLCKISLRNIKDLRGAQISANRGKKSLKGDHNAFMIINPSS